MPNHSSEYPLSKQMDSAQTAKECDLATFFTDLVSRSEKLSQIKQPLENMNIKIKLYFTGSEMYLVGGWSPSGAVDSVFMIDLHEKVPQTWREQKKLAQPLYSSCVINWEGKILITGGGSKQKDSTEEILDMKTVEFYDPNA